MKKQNRYFPAIITFMLCCLFSSSLLSQSSLTLDSCQILARQHYPLIRQFELIEKTKSYSIDNAYKNKLPQVTLAGQATYQSDVTSIPISFPDIHIPQPGKDQYKLYGEVSQSINDLYTLKDKLALIDGNTEVEKQRIEVELYKLKDRINQLFFGILLVDAQLTQTELLKKDIQVGLEKINASIENGTAIKSNATQLEAELIKGHQRTIELKSTRRAYMDILSAFIHRPIDDNTKFNRPLQPIFTSTISRAELRLYDAQRFTYDLQNKIIRNNNLPQFNVFLQAGVGNPALNVLSEDFDPYYIGGLRFSWNLTRKYTYKNDMQLLNLQQETLDQQRETFLFNLDLINRHQSADIDKLQELIATDHEMIDLRESVTNTTKVQLENGTATTNDYILILNAADQARLNLVIHEIQLLQAQYNYLINTGQSF